MDFSFAVLLLLGIAAGAFCKTEFEILDDEFGGFHLKVLRNPNTGENVSIIYDFGGRVESLNLLSRASKQVRPLLWTHDRNATAVRENESWRGQLLLPYASRVEKASYTFFGKTYHLPLNEPERDNALHGLIFNKTLAILSQTVNVNHARLLLGYNFTGDDQGYPFLLGITVEYTLEHLIGQTRFSVRITFKNLMKNDPLLFSAGWHPYFLCSAYKTVVTLDDCTEWDHVEWANNSNIHSSLIPTGSTNVWTNFSNGNPIGGTSKIPTYYDDEFKPLAGVQTCPLLSSRIHDPTSGDTIVMWQDSGYRFVHIFTGGRGRWGVDAVAVEPQSAMTNCFNNHDGLNILSAGQSWIGTFGVFMAH